MRLSLTRRNRVGREVPFSAKRHNPVSDSRKAIFIHIFSVQSCSSLTRESSLWDPKASKSRTPYNAPVIKYQNDAILITTSTRATTNDNLLGTHGMNKLWVERKTPTRKPAIMIEEYVVSYQRNVLENLPHHPSISTHPTHFTSAPYSHQKLTTFNTITTEMTSHNGPFLLFLYSPARSSIHFCFYHFPFYQENWKCVCSIPNAHIIAPTSPPTH